MEMVGGSPRAVVRNEQRQEVWYLYLVWIEDWTSNPMSAQKSAVA